MYAMKIMKGEILVSHKETDKQICIRLVISIVVLFILYQI